MVAIAQLTEADATRRSDLERAGNCAGIVGEQLAEAMRRAQIVLVVARIRRPGPVTRVTPWRMQVTRPAAAGALE